MSIIFDALKKTEGQNPDQPEQPKPTTDKNQKAPTPPTGKKTSKGVDILIKVLAGILLIAALAFFANSMASQAQKKEVKRKVNETQSFLRKFFKLNVSRKVTKKGAEGVTINLNDFNLQGILFSEEKPIAMINNGAYKIGDKLNQVTIKNIKERSVTLENNGTEAVLQLR